MGLLDQIGAYFNTGDQELNAARQHGLLQAGLAMLGKPGNLGAILGNAGQVGMQGMQQFQERQFQQKVREDQLRQIQQKKVLDELPGKYTSPAQQIPGPVQPGEAPLPTIPGAIDLEGLVQGYMQSPGGLQTGLALKQAITKDTTPVKVGKDERLYSRDLKTVLVDAVPKDPAEKQTQLGLTLAEMQGLPAGDPRLPIYNDMVKKLTTHQPAAQQNVNLKQEGEEAKAVGKAFGEQYADIQKAGFGAQGKIARAQRMTQLLDGVQTGKFTPIGTEIASGMASLGINIDKNLPNKQAAEALANEMALELRNPAGGAGMPGAMSDADRVYLKSMTANIGKTPETNKLILEAMVKIAERDQEVAARARKYRLKHRTLNEGFYDELDAFSKENPLFKGAATSSARPPLSSFKR